MSSRLGERHGDGWAKSLPMGAMVATVLPAGCFLIAERRGDRLGLEGYGRDPGDLRPDPWGDFRQGRWIRVLDDVVRLDPPEPAIGGRKLWRREPTNGDEEKR